MQSFQNVDAQYTRAFLNCVALAPVSRDSHGSDFIANRSKRIEMGW